MIKLLSEVLETMTGEESLDEVIKKRDALEMILETGEERDNAIAGQIDYLTAVIENIRDYNIVVMARHRTAVEDYASSPNTPSKIETMAEELYPTKGESDPNGTAPHTAGAKMDSGKPLAGSCIAAFAKALQGVIDVYTFGAEKYCKDGWEKVPDGENRYRDALYRHLLAHEETPLDPDSGMSHLSHACWNLLALYELVLRRQETDADEVREGINEDAGC